MFAPAKPRNDPDVSYFVCVKGFNIIHLNSVFHDVLADATSNDAVILPCVVLVGCWKASMDIGQFLACLMTAGHLPSCVQPLRHTVSCPDIAGY